MGIKINFSQKTIALIIVLIATVAGIALVAPFFKPGIPINIDLPVHYSRIWCYEESPIWSLPTFWCPYFGAGTAFYQGYPILAFQVMALLSSILFLEFAFKLVVALIYFVLPFSALLLLWKFVNPLAGAFAYLFLIIEHGGWHNGGFEQVFSVGMFSNALGSGMLILGIFFAIDFFKEPSNKKFIYWILSGTAVFLSHIVPFTMYSIFLLIIAGFYWNNVKNNWKYIASFPIFIFLISGFWSLPLIARRLQGYYGNAFGGPTWDWNFFLTYSWGPLNKWVFALSIIGLIFAFRSKRKELLILGSGIIAIFAIWLLSYYVRPLYLLTPLSKLLSLPRLAGDLRSLLFIFAAFGAFSLTNLKLTIEKKQISVYPVVLIVIAIISFGAYGATKNYSESIMTDSLNHQDILYQKQVYSMIPKTNARIIPYEVLYRVGQSPLSFTHFESLLPVLTKQEVLLYNGIKMKEDYGDYGQIALLNLYKTKEDLQKFFERLNVKYILAIPVPELKDKLNTLAVAKNISPYVLYDTGITPSYFSLGKGNVIEEDYDGYNAEITLEASETTSLLFKVHDYPNWYVQTDSGRNLRKINEPGYLMEIEVPPGKHTIQFSYRMTVLDYFAYLLSAVGIAALFYIKKFKLS